MNLLSQSNTLKKITSSHVKIIIAGLLYTLAYAPFNLPGMLFISLALFYSLIVDNKPVKSFQSGLLFGFALFGSGVSWVLISIHDYGNIAYFPAFLITLLFIFYLSLFPALTAGIFSYLQQPRHLLFSSLLFAALWVLFEWTRATLMTGFPWLLAGTSQINAPLKYLAPVTGTYGLGFISALASAFIANSFRCANPRKPFYIIAAVCLIFLPISLKKIQWTQVEPQPLTTAVIQLNMSMREKWDDHLFWEIVNHYQQAVYTHLNKDLIVMPESSIPAPDIYVQHFLQNLDEKAKVSNSAILLGILKTIQSSEKDTYQNAILSLGQAHGHYAKRHLVPFGEYFPALLHKLNDLLPLPLSDMTAGRPVQQSIQIKDIPIATLICYEIAYPALLDGLLPNARFIVSISDNGWFGHSLASFQQLQMARMLSLQTGRYMILANNDGLSSIIDTQGNIVKSLPAFQAGVLEAEVFKATGSSPWVIFGDLPLLLLALSIFTIALFLKIKGKLMNQLLL